MWQINAVDAFLEKFVGVLDAAIGLIEGPILGLYDTFLILGIAALSVFLLKGGAAYFDRLGPRVLYLGAMGFILDNFMAVSTAISKSFIWLGLAAGGGAMAEYTFLHPGLLAQFGDTAVEPLRHAASQVSLLGWGGLDLVIWYGIAAFFLKLSFYVLATMVFVAIIAFKLGVVTAFVLAAASALPRFAWIASGGFGFVISAGVGLFSYALIISVVTSVTATLFDGATAPPTEELISLAILTAVANFGLALLGPAMIKSVMSGVANMGLGAAATAVGAAALTIAAPVAGGLAVARASQGLVSSAASGVRLLGSSATKGTGAISQIPAQKAALQARGSSGAIGGMGGSTAKVGSTPAKAITSAPAGFPQQKLLPPPSSRGISSVHAARALVPDGTDQGGGMMAPSNLERS